MGGADFTLVPIMWKETSTEVDGKKTSIFSKHNIMYTEQAVAADWRGVIATKTPRSAALFATGCGMTLACASVRSTGVEPNVCTLHSESTEWQLSCAARRSELLE